MGPPAEPSPVVEEVQVHGQPPTSEHDAASDSTTTQSELSLRPRYRAEGVLDAVPGLFAVQHSGGGKAEQYFMRGFDLDHGTDVAFFVDGVPVNAVSHAHGQGFSDLHFVIPETIASLDSTKGPYSASVGDFATAGSVMFRMADHVDESIAKVELGTYGHQRAVVVESPAVGDKWRVIVAAEVFHEDGPFVHPEDFGRLNAYAKVTRALDERSDLSFTLMAYGGTWNASGVLPARAVCGEGDGTPTPAAYAGSHCLSRWDSADPSQGGGAQRLAASASYRSRLGRGWDLDAIAFAVHSNLQLFPNDGISASFQPDPQYGSQIEQDDTRTETGANVRLVHRALVAGVPTRSTVGLSVRADSIAAQVHRTRGRVRLDGVDAAIPGPVVDDAINEDELALYAEEELRPARWLRFVAGARVDRIDVAVNDESQTAIDHVSGVRGAGQLSPKWTAVVSPLDALDFNVNYGRGFHSNDARTIVGGSAATLIATATGYEIGATARPIPGLSLSAVAFLLDLASELTLNGDTATTSPSGSTRRLGGEITGRYHLRDDVYADAALSVTRARYTDAVDVAAGTTYVPLAPRRTFSAGIGAREPVGAYTLLGSVHMKSMADRPATKSFGPNGGVGLTATGFTLVDAEIGVRWRALEVAADVLNVANTPWREGQIAVDSRLPLEGPNPPTGISFTPGLPRTLLVRAALHW
jgi:hypothetical protein